MQALDQRHRHRRVQPDDRILAVADQFRKQASEQRDLVVVKTGCVDRRKWLTDDHVRRDQRFPQIVLAIVMNRLFHHDDLKVLGQAGQQLLRTLKYKIPAQVAKHNNFRHGFSFRPWRGDG